MKRNRRRLGWLLLATLAVLLVVAAGRVALWEPLPLVGEGPGDPFARAAGVGPSVVKGLAKLGVIEAVALPRPPAFEEPDWRRSGAALSPAQAEAAGALRASP